MLINDEAHLPYQRPPLSKAYLKGTGGPDSLMFRPQKFFADQTIELISDHAVAIDRDARKLKLASGGALDYGHLVLATGARNRLLDIPNAKLAERALSAHPRRQRGSARSGSPPASAWW